MISKIRRGGRYLTRGKGDAMNKICEHCKYKRFTCPIFRCDPYKLAKMKQAERRIYKMFPIEDYDGEDRYYAGVIFGITLLVVALVMMLLSTIRTIGAWKS